MSEDDNKPISFIDRKRAMEIDGILDNVDPDDSDIDIDLYQDDEWLKKLNKRHAIILNCEGYKEPMILTYVPNPNGGHPSIKFINRGAFEIVYSNQTVQYNDKTMELGKWWTRCTARREFNSTMFDPRRPTEFNNCFNTWQGLAVEPKAGNWKLINKHIYNILCNADRTKYDYVIKWFAWMLQNPGDRAETALVFKGKQGAGKGVIFNQFVEIFGAHGMAISSGGNLTGRFNSHLAKTVFLFSDEAFHAGDREAEGVLKQLITEPTIAIEAKYQAVESYRNCLHVVMASNEKWVVPVHSDTRRFFINEVNDRYAKNMCPDSERQAYFNTLNHEIDKGGTAAMLYDLLNLDLKGFHPRYDVPITDALIEQQEYSIDKASKGLLELLKEGIFPGEFDDAQYKTNMVQLREYIEKIYPQFRTVSHIRLGAILREFSVAKRRASSNNYWSFPSLEFMRSEWDKKCFKVQWEAPNIWRTMTYTNKQHKEVDF